MQKLKIISLSLIFKSGDDAEKVSRIIQLFVFFSVCALEISGFFFKEVSVCHKALFYNWDDDEMIVGADFPHFQRFQISRFLVSSE